MGLVLWKFDCKPRSPFASLNHSNLYTYPCPFWNRTTFLSDLVAGRNLTHVYFSHSVIATRIMYSSFSPTEHYENMPMQYTEIFKVVRNENFHQKKI